MKKREVIINLFEGNDIPYVPWAFGFTAEARNKLIQHWNAEDWESKLENHILALGSGIGFFKELENDRFQDVFGVIWNRSEDKDIGVIEGCLLPEPSMGNYQLPDPHQEIFYQDIPEKTAQNQDLYRIFNIGFSLYERAWTLRGMENLMIDFIANPEFVHELMGTIAEYNIELVKEALKYDIDAVYFGDDWGQQHGLIMGPKIWHEFIYPELKKMYSAVKSAGKKVFIHSCGDVDELFDDLIEIGLDCFNPFQPEVMDTFELMDKYRGRLCFHGGLSTQRTLPYGTPDDVRRETSKLLEYGLKNKNYIFAPAHAVEGDVPLENILAFIETVQAQPGYKTLTP
jgi:uroporphyrinogen decarboxylase